MRGIICVCLLILPGCAVSRSTVVISTTVDDVDVRYECELIYPGLRSDEHVR